jgi:hypothetical protein
MSEERPDLSAYMPEGWEGILPPCQIQVTTEGELMHNGLPIVHPEIRAEIFSSIHLEDGHYILRIGGQACEVEVADTFFVVRGVEAHQGRLQVTLNDGSQEEIDPADLWLGEGDMVYCRVKGGRFPARFARPAYYQLARWVEEGESGFVLALEGRRYPLAQSEG